eukprot:TRINITY_DN3093_c0_g1_i1.p1 TRINITY_DN3093_c0_g1~~TRINITY_DN3093_c0_g1_i1.p1  ORF type:complete len:663 (-),score=240.22 TRINITY_DN3093_c0_g1_i1:68-2056(-)
MAVILKIKFGDDTRRITLERTPSYDELVRIVNQLFGNTSGLQLKYEDEDKDQITVTTQAELTEAFTISSRHFNNVLRIFVSEPKKTASTTTSATTTASTTGDLATSLTGAELCFLKDLISSANLAKSNPDVLGSPAIRQVLSHLGLSSSTSFPSPSNPPYIPPSASPSAAPYVPRPHSFSSMGFNSLRTSGGSSPNLHEPFASSEQTPSLSSSSSSPAASSSPAVHYGVTCDGCSTADITGNRYKCAVCKNYDLCEKCKIKGDEVHPTSHPMKILATPVIYQRRNFGGARDPSRHNSHQHSSAIGSSAPSSLRQKPIARFVKDVTIPDGTRVAVGTKVVKTWRVRNEGDSWPSGAVLVHVGGENLTTNTTVPIPSAAPGEEVDISVELNMPSVPGRYNTFWRLCTAEGNRFGQRMWADIVACPVPASIPISTTTTTPSVEQEQLRQQKLQEEKAKELLEKEEKERLEREREEKERFEREKEEKERIEREEREVAERKEKERAEREEKERVEREERERVEREERERLEREEKERVEREEKERAEREQMREELEKEEARMRAHQEQLRIASETLALRNQQETARIRCVFEEQERAKQAEEKADAEMKKLAAEEEEKNAVEACRKQQESDAIKQLVEMGFNSPNLLTILRKHNGDVTAVIEELMQ